MFPSSDQQQSSHASFSTSSPASNVFDSSTTLSSNDTEQTFNSSQTPTPPPVVPPDLQSSISPPPGFSSKNANVERSFDNKSESPIVDMSDSNEESADEDEHFQDASSKPPRVLQSPEQETRDLIDQKKNGWFLIH